VVSILLALAAAVSWGVSDFMGGLFARRLPIGSVLLISQGVGFGVLLVLALFRGPPTMDATAVAYAMAASATGLTGIAALYRGMAVGLVSIVAPISATGAALPVVYGILRGELPTPLQATGICVALLGVLLASRSESSAGSKDSDGSHDSAGSKGAEVGTRKWHVPVVARGVGLAIVAAVCFGAFFIFMHEAATADVLWAIVIQRLTGVSILSLLALARRAPISVNRRELAGLAAVGVLDSGANVLYALASTIGLVSLAAVLVSLFPVVTVILAWIVLHERLTRSQTVGVVSALAGVALIAVA
jgi:drug/metabolite transporter (DMT)-like permease